SRRPPRTRAQAGRRTGSCSSSASADPSLPRVAVRLEVVLSKEVDAEVALRVAPHRVDVVRAVLGVVVLHDEVASLHPVVVTLAVLQPTGPGEVDRRQPRPLDARPLLGGDVGPVAIEVDVDELGQQTLLQITELCVAD